MLRKCSSRILRKPNKLLQFASRALAWILAFHLAIAVTNAQESTWTNPFGGDFDKATNWDNGVPAAGTDAVFDLNATYQVNTDGDHNVQSIIQRQGNVTFDGNDRLLALGLASVENGILSIDGAGTTLEASENLSVGLVTGNNGNLNISNGALVSNADAYLGVFAGSSGNVSVTGDGSIWQNDNLYLGTPDQNSDGGVGHIEIDSSARLAVGNRQMGVGLFVGDTGSNGNLILRNGSTITTSGSGAFIIGLDDAEGNVTIDGPGSRIEGFGRNELGLGGVGFLTVQNGGTFSGRNLIVGSEHDAIGPESTLTVDGSGSIVDSDLLLIGNSGSGLAIVKDGGILVGDVGEIDYGGSVDVSGENSALAVGDLTVGGRRAGDLRIHSGGGAIGINAVLGDTISAAGIASGGNATVEGAGSQWNLTGELAVGRDGFGNLQISDTGSVFAESAVIGGGTGRGTTTVSGTGSSLQIGNSLTLGSTEASTGALNVDDGALVSTTNASLGLGSLALGEIVVDGAGSRFEIANDLVAGTLGTARIEATNGGVITAKSTNISGASSSILVDGVGSRLENGGALIVGEQGFGGLEVSQGGFAASSLAVVGVNGEANLVVKDAGSQFQTGEISLGIANEGRIGILAGGLLSSTDTIVGINSGGSGIIDVQGSDSHWNNTGDLTFGASTESRMTIDDDGLVTVDGATFVNDQSTVSINGGRFEFGTTDIASFNQFEGTSGSVAGDVNLTGYNHVETLTLPGLDHVDVSEVRITNSGVVFGDGVSRVALDNTTSGEVRTLSNQSIRFRGINNVNSGEINNFGGLVEFENDFVNKEEGFVGGRGQFIAGGGFANLGVMAFTADDTDILGDFLNADSGTVITSGGAVTTFFDDVVHNGAEIRTAEGSQTVFLGEVSGTMNFTGVGNVFMEGDLRPGNSPDVVSFEGSLFLGGGAQTAIEIAGLGLGEFDRLEIDGDFFVNGQLSVELIDGFVLGSSQEFLFADVGQSLVGQFAGYGEGDLIGRFGQRDLFISYTRGDGNDIALFTSVPEPSSAAFIILLSTGFLIRRKRSGS